MQELIDSLREALQFSPDNIPLKQQLAKTLLQAGNIDEAVQEYLELVQLSPTSSSKTGLAKAYFKQAKYSQANVILEELLEEDPHNIPLLLLHAKALLREKSLFQSQDIYQHIIELNPEFQDEELDREFRISNQVEREDEYEDVDDFFEKPNIGFNEVGGMEKVKKEIELKIIKPLEHAEMYKTYGKKIGGGILLYGPPGCGKTFIAKATAGEINANFINVGLSDILDMWIGQSEKNLHQIFEKARYNAPCVLFFDEIDALGASRSDMRQSSGRHIINQFLMELDGVENDNDGVLILGATNTPWNLDSAFRRPGRFDRIIFVPPPDEQAREEIIKLKMEGKPAADIDFEKIAKKTKDFSGADIEAIIDIAIEEKLSASFSDGIPKPIETKDLLKAVNIHKASTREWFSTAKNYALFANDSGLYDDILHHMNKK